MEDSDEIRIVAEGVGRMTVNLDEDDVGLFEDLWPVPHGVSLHAYLIRGERLVVVDPWDEGGYGPEEIGADLESAGLDWTKITAVAFSRQPADDLMERLREIHPGLEDWGLPQAGIHHDLGAGVSLESRDGFWFVAPQGVLLTGDVFSGLGWIEDELWAEDLTADPQRHFDDEALRFFSLRPLAPAKLPSDTHIVAPSHGCLFREPQRAIDRSLRFEAWGQGEALDEVTVVWPDGANEGAEALVGGALEIGVGLNLLRVPGDDLSALAAAARKASLVVVAEGLNEGFLAGLNKEVWRPKVSTPAALLRSGLVEKWEGGEA